MFSSKNSTTISIAVWKAWRVRARTPRPPSRNKMASLNSVCFDCSWYFVRRNPGRQKYRKCQTGVEIPMYTNEHTCLVIREYKHFKNPRMTIRGSSTRSRNKIETWQLKLCLACFQIIFWEHDLKNMSKQKVLQIFLIRGVPHDGTKTTLAK